MDHDQISEAVDAGCFEVVDVLEIASMKDGGDGVAFIQIVHDQVMVAGNEDNGCEFCDLSQKVQTQNDGVGCQFVFGVEQVPRNDHDATAFGERSELFEECLKNEIVLLEAGGETDMDIGEMEDVIEGCVAMMDNGFHDHVRLFRRT